MENDFEHYYNATIRLKKENAELKARIADIKEDRITYCAYCGEEFPIDAGGTPDAVSSHIHNCPKHPIQDYKTEIADLKRDRIEAVKAERERIKKFFETGKYGSAYWKMTSWWEEAWQALQG
uniref:Uncharacterized protein n=1 Tax=viral metagenome TaxID=1070528 RepID=A0A6M3K5Q5_9ZZZZ